MEDCKARKTAKATTKQSAKTKAAKPLPEAGASLTRSWIIVSTGSMVINCTDGLFSLGTSMLVLVYNSTEKIVAMAEDQPPPPILVDIPREKTGRCCGVQKNIQAAPEDSESENYSGAESKQGSDEVGTHSTEERLLSDDEKKRS